jgi:hypothetical protein
MRAKRAPRSPIITYSILYSSLNLRSSLNFPVLRNPITVPRRRSCGRGRRSCGRGRSRRSRSRSWTFTKDGVVCIGIYGICGASGTDFKCEREAMTAAKAHISTTARRSASPIVVQWLRMWPLGGCGICSTQIVSGSTASRSPPSRSVSPRYLATCGHHYQQRRTRHALDNEKRCPTQRAATSAQTRQKRGPMYHKKTTQKRAPAAGNTEIQAIDRPESTENRGPMCAKPLPREGEVP